MRSKKLIAVGKIKNISINDASYVEINVDNWIGLSRG